MERLSLLTLPSFLPSFSWNLLPSCVLVATYAIPRTDITLVKDEFCAMPQWGLGGGVWASRGWNEMRWTLCLNLGSA